MYRNQSGLPVMAVNHIGLKADHRERRQRSLGEKRELLQVPIPVPIRLGPVKIALIVDKVKGDSLVDLLQYPHIPVLPQIVHIKMIQISHIIAV